jgi:hypothetical protein
MFNAWVKHEQNSLNKKPKLDQYDFYIYIAPLAIHYRDELG